MAAPKRRGKDRKKEVGLEIYGEQEKSIEIKYNSTFNYKEFEIEDLKDELINSEKKIFISINAIQKNNFIIAENLYQVHKKLASRKTGTYVAWCDSIGITRNKSADLLNAYSLYLETNKEDALKLPIRVIREINKSKNKISNDDLISVISSDVPSKKFEEVKNKMLHSATLEEKIKEEVIEAEIVQTDDEIKFEMLADIERDKKDVKERERNLKKLKLKIEEKEKMFEEKFGKVD